MSEDNYTDTNNVQQVNWLREGDSPIPDEAVAYMEEAIEVMTTSVFTEDFDLTDTPENFQESLRGNREAIYEAFRKADDVLCEALGEILTPLAKEYAEELHGDQDEVQEEEGDK